MTKKRDKKAIIKNISIIGIIFIILASFSYFTYDTLLNQTVIQNHFSGTRNGDAKIGPLKEGDVVEQEFLVSTKKLVGMGININDLKHEIFSGELEVELLDAGNRTVLASKTLTTGDINNSGYTYFQFDEPVYDQYDEKLILRIKVVDLAKGSSIFINASEKDTYTDENMYLNQESNRRDIDMSLMYIPYDAVYKVVIMLLLFMLLFIPTVYYFLIIKKVKIERVFLVALVCLEFIYMGTIIPNTVPDEETHEFGAYNISNLLLGESDSEDGMLPMRECDTVVNIQAGRPDRQQYNYFYGNILKKAERTNIVEVDKSGYPYNSIQKFLYFFSGVGITVGRLMGLGLMPTLLLGRLFNLIFYCVLGYYAIKQIPFGKTVLMVLMLFPISLQQAMSFSYDAIINPMAFALIAICLKMAYDKEHVKKHNYIMYVILSALLMQVKGGAYIPLVFLILLPIMICRKEIKKKENISKKDKVYKRYRALIISMLMIFVIFVPYKIWSVIFANPYNTGGSEGIIEWAGAPGYTIGYLLQHPLKIFCVLWSTIYDKFEFYLESFAGQGLGWFKIDVPLLSYVFIIILLLAAIKVAGEPEYFTKKSRIFMVVIGLICFAACNGGMLLGWTPITTYTIEGVQGRYFLPFILTLLLIIRSNKIELKNHIDRYLLFAMIAVQPFVIYCIEHDAMCK